MGDEREQENRPAEPDETETKATEVSDEDLEAASGGHMEFKKYKSPFDED